MSNPSAPIDISDLAGALLPFGASTTLPDVAYTSPDVFAWEMKHFFGNSWLCLGRFDNLLAIGQVKAIRSGGHSLLIARATDGDYRAFWNVCRHRGHELVIEGTTQDVRLIRCPYHSWTYRLDGTLRAAPQYQEIEDFRLADYPLQSLPLVAWNGWLFIRPSVDGIDLQTQLGNLDGVLAPWRLDELTVGASHEYVANANWKLIVENYHECYHCTTIHPALCKVTPPDSGNNIPPTGWWTGGTMDLRDHADTMSFDGRSPVPPFDYLKPDLRRQVWYLGLFPNLLISTHPDYVMTHLLTPLAPDRTHIWCQWLFRPEIVASEGFDPSYATDFWDQTNREDWGATEGVQRGAASVGYLPGPLSPAEGNVFMFIRMVAKGYRDGYVEPPDRPATAAYRESLIG